MVSGLGEEVVEAFRLLNLTRTGNGFGPNPLNLAEIKAFIDLYGLPLLPIDIFVSLLLTMDRKYLDLVLAKQKQEPRFKGAKGGGRKT